MNKVDSKLVTLVLFFFLAFGFFTVSVVSRQALRIQASKNIVPDASSSLLLAFPLNTTVGQTSTINCVARDSTGTAAANKKCVVTTSCGNISPSEVLTNTNGIAQFSLASVEPCTAQLNATIDGTIPVSQTTSVQFTQ